LLVATRVYDLESGFARLVLHDIQCISVCC